MANLRRSSCLGDKCWRLLTALWTMRLLGWMAAKSVELPSDIWFFCVPVEETKSLAFFFVGARSRLRRFVALVISIALWTPCLEVPATWCRFGDTGNGKWFWRMTLSLKVLCAVNSFEKRPPPEGGALWVVGFWIRGVVELLGTKMTVIILPWRIKIRGEKWASGICFCHQILML